MKKYSSLGAADNERDMKESELACFMSFQSDIPLRLE